MTAERITGVLLTGAEIGLALHAIRNLQAARRRNGLAPDRRYALLASVLAGDGQSGSPSGPVPQTDGADVIDIAELARLLGYSERTARRLAPGLGGRQVGGRWVVDRLAIAQHLEGKALRDQATSQ